jgi:hypothetical protein
MVMTKKAICPRAGIRNFSISPGEIIGFLEWGSGVS